MSSSVGSFIRSCIRDFTSRPSFRGEWIWMSGRFAAVLGIVTLILSGQESSNQQASIISLLFVACYVLISAVLLLKRHLVAAFSVGTVGDLTGLMGGWLATLVAQQDSPQESDGYLIMFLVLLALPYRYGTYMGGMIGLVLISWVATVSYIWLPHDLYTIEQYPTRIVFFLSTLGLAIALSNHHTSRARALAISTRVAERLSAVNDAKDAVLSTVTHELKTPLTVISAMIGVVRRNREQNLTEKQLGQLDVVMRNTDQLSVLIDDLVSAVQIQRGTLSYKPRRFDLHAMVVTCISDTRPIAEKRGVTVDFDCQVDSLDIWADENRLVQVVSNLLSNAYRYAVANTTVRVVMRSDGQMVDLAVENVASEMDDESVSRLFNAFVRLDNEQTRSQPGTGLGLYISKNIVEHHGGSIGAELEDDVFRVSVSLPVGEEDDVTMLAVPGDAPVFSDQDERLSA